MMHKGYDDKYISNEYKYQQHQQHIINTNEKLTCRPNQSPSTPPKICPTIIPPIKTELHNPTSDSDGGCLHPLIKINANEILIVLYAALKLEIMERRMSA